MIGQDIHAWAQENSVTSGLRLAIAGSLRKWQAILDDGEYQNAIAWCPLCKEIQFMGGPQSVYGCHGLCPLFVDGSPCFEHGEYRKVYDRRYSLEDCSDIPEDLKSDVIAYGKALTEYFTACLALTKEDA